MNDVPESHPRYQSLRIRNRIVEGMERGITSVHGLIAQGRGEAFDYLLGEETNDFALEAIQTSAALLLQADHPVISVNGNAAALVADELVALAKCLDAPLEVNLFHPSKQREEAIFHHLKQHGASRVLIPTEKTQLDYLDSNRKFVHPQGIHKADVVFVPLEDGDRCQALRKMDKEVITVDLNPLSRTAQSATITIVDNLVRAMDPLIAEVVRLEARDRSEWEDLVSAYDNQKILRAALDHIRDGI